MVNETGKEKDSRIKKQRWHRLFNSAISTIVLTILIIGAFKGGDIKEEYDLQTEIQNIIEHEGFVAHVYKDSLGKDTIGYGHLVKPGEKFGKISYKTARELLYKDYVKARDSVGKKYPWASGEVRLVLINMTYQLGERGVSKFKKALAHLEAEKYGLASDEMLDSRWGKQTPRRARKQAARIMNLDRSLW